MHRYTAMVRFPGETRSTGHWEEIDVDARSKKEARKLAKAELERDYKQGWTTIRIIGPRVGFYT